MWRVWLILTILFCHKSYAQYEAEGCPPVDSTFEIITGFMYSAPNDILLTKPGTLLADCLQTCKQNISCQAINFETGLCVLFRSQGEDTADALIKSQFPVFTIYAQKRCLPSARSCHKAWAFELVRGYAFKYRERKEMEMPSRMACLDACIQEREFHCRSATWDVATNVCVMADMDRYSQSGIPFVSQPNMDYMESQCVEEPNRMCEFRKVEGRLLKTVDSLLEGVTDEAECRQLCLNAPFRCHTYDFEGVCRLSHHSSETLTQIEEPYLLKNGSISYERSTCYNVTLDCQAHQLIASISTNKIFKGKVYPRARPNSCAVDVKNSLDFEITMEYADANCGIRQTEPGRYVTDLVLQHHDLIMTSSDIGFTLRCAFHLENKTVSHGPVVLQVLDMNHIVGSESAIVPSPNVVMKITDRSGGDISSAQVGDPLALRFEITEKSSPYEIFVRDLVASSGNDGGSIILVDYRGCPTDATIMGSVVQVPSNTPGKALQAAFEAFKFPTSDIVQFQALITPCLPHCEPVNCSIPGDPSTGGEFIAESYGKRRRRRSPETSEGEQLLVVNQLKISDPFEKKGFEETNDNEYGDDLSGQPLTPPTSCLNWNSLIFLAAVFLAIQIVIVGGWCFYLSSRRHSHLKSKEAQMLEIPHHQFGPYPHIIGGGPNKFRRHEHPVLPRL